MGPYFEGLYFKQQNKEETVALIPGLHRDLHGKQSAFIQIITEKEAHFIPYPSGEAVLSRQKDIVHVGGSRFSPQGVFLDIHKDGVCAQGNLRFEGLSPLCYDIMGPFVFVPGMECRHKVVSVRHRVAGELTINGRRHVFDDGAGYIEGDRGCSFPREYLWTQCISRSPSCSIMLSVAEIPLFGRSFTGVIGFVKIKNREYRLATYLGATVHMEAKRAAVRQGRFLLTAELLEQRAHALRAPVGGGMTRLIRESPSCLAHYRFTQGDEVLLDFTSAQAGFEYEYQTEKA